MFDQAQWRTSIQEGLGRFARQPHQEVHLTGCNGLLGYLALRTIEPLLTAYEASPVQAIVVLAALTRGPGADQLVRNATRLRLRGGAYLDRQIRSSAVLRSATEELISGLRVLELARQNLNTARDEWLVRTLRRELDQYPGEFDLLRRELADRGWQSRYDALRALRARKGVFSESDMQLLYESLTDGTSFVRAAAARTLGQLQVAPTTAILKALLRTALHDSDLETRYAAARSLGSLREHIATAPLINHLSMALSDTDHFVRSAVALVLGQLGERAACPEVLTGLMGLLQDDDSYTREAAARALGRLGSPAATDAVLVALSQALQDDDANVHEAALDALSHLRTLRELPSPTLSFAA